MTTTSSQIQLGVMGLWHIAPCPSGWQNRRLRFLTRINKQIKVNLPPETEVSFVPMAAIGENGGIQLDQTKSIDEVGDGYTPFADGDVIVAKITPCFENGKGALAEGLKNGVAFGTTELHVVRPGEQVDKRFLFYLSITELFRKLGEGAMYGAGGQKRVPDLFVKDFWAPLPPLHVQEKIATFLVRKTVEIDALIAKKRRLLGLLVENRTALITRAVTKGLNPDAPMEDSGVEWLGEVPEHWDICGLGQKIKLQRGVDITKNERVDGSYPVVSSGGVEFFHDAALCPGPGVLIGRKGSAGKLHFIERDYWPHDTALYVREFRGNHPRFVWYMLHILDLTSFDSGSSNPTVNRNRVHPMITAWPPHYEQKSITESLDQMLVKLDNHAERIAASIKLLIEYRSALITNAVTGQIKVE